MIDSRTKGRAGNIELGLRDERVNLGDHIAYFWEKPSEFEEAVEFLCAGQARGDHLVVFGHGEANDSPHSPQNRRPSRLSA